MKRAMRTQWTRRLGIAAALVLCLGWGAPARADASTIQGVEQLRFGERQPSLRKIDWQQDRAMGKRIWYYRNRLPEEFRRQNNFAWARADIPGLRKKEFYAHSRIQSLDALSSREAKRISGISPRPEYGQGRFRTLFVDWQGNIGGAGAIPRWFDTEYKIMEDIASRLPEEGARGKITLFTELKPCLSCWGVMMQFMSAYPDIDIEVLYNWP